MAETYFANLSSPRVAALLTADRIPVLLLPIGAVEPHGPHGPLATDAIISQGVCARAAHALADDPRLRALVLPELPYGVTRCATGFTGAISVSESTLHALILEVCTALIDDGFRHLVIVNNHFEPAHLATIRRAIDTVQANHRVLVGHLDLVRRQRAALLTDEFQAGECHAGSYETSLVLADHPELVDTEEMRTLPRVEVNMPAAMRAGQLNFRSMGMDRAYCGSPARASAEEGARTFSTLTAMLVELVRELVTGV